MKGIMKKMLFVICGLLLITVTIAYLVVLKKPKVSDELGDFIETDSYIEYEEEAKGKSEVDETWSREEFVDSNLAEDYQSDLYTRHDKMIAGRKPEVGEQYDSISTNKEFWVPIDLGQISVLDKYILYPKEVVYEYLDNDICDLAYEKLKDDTALNDMLNFILNTYYQDKFKYYPIIVDESYTSLTLSLWLEDKSYIFDISREGDIIYTDIYVDNTPSVN